jgi:hypothetical protein
VNNNFRGTTAVTVGINTVPVVVTDANSRDLLALQITRSGRQGIWAEPPSAGGEIESDGPAKSELGI